MRISQLPEELISEKSTPVRVTDRVNLRAKAKPASLELSLSPN